MKASIRKASIFASLVSLTILSLSAYSEAIQVAQIGVYDGEGKVQLMSDRFLETFQNGAVVEDLKTLSINGYLHLSRKGYSDDGACRTERIQLVDSLGTPLMEGSDPFEGKKVFIRSALAMRIVACMDDGCHALKNVVLPGEPRPIRAACDITDTSDNQCACHIDRGYGDELVRDGLFCKSSGYFLPADLSTWVLLKWLSYETIPV